MIKMKHLIYVLLIILPVSLYGCGKEQTHAEIMEESRKSIEKLDLLRFNAWGFSGSKQLTQEDLKEYDLTVLYFWATWSDISQNLLPGLAAYKKELPKNIRVIVACVDGDKNRRIAKRILNNAGYKGRVILSGNMDYNRLCETIRCLPSIVFFDSNGNQAGKPIIGVPEDFEKDMDRAISDILDVDEIRTKKSK